jgi:hypothetical protein
MGSAPPKAGLARRFPYLDLAASPAFATPKPPRQLCHREAIGAEFDQAMRK